MVVAEDRHRHVEAAIRERQVLGPGVDYWGSEGAALADHDLRRFDGRYVTVGRLVGTGAGADVYDRAGRAQRLPDGPGDPRISAPSGRVGPPNVVIGEAGQSDLVSSGTPL